MLFFRVLLLLSSVFCLSSAKAPKDGSRCEAEGRIGKCILWEKCPSIAEMMQRNPPRESELIYVEKFNCGYKRGLPYFCCVEGLETQPVAPQPQQPARPNPSDEHKYIAPNPLANHPNRNLLPLNTCGKQEKNYIVGGEQARLGEFPWLALIHYNNDRRNGKFMCGGSLINNRYVLTAAHCLHLDRLSGYIPDMVRLGEHNLETDPDIQRGKEGRFMQADPVVDIMIEATIIHEDYMPFSGNQFHDIGLIRLNRDARTTRFVKPICLPTTEAENGISVSKKDVNVAGWGNTETGSRSLLKMKVAVPLVDTYTCAAAYSKFKRNVTFTQLCAGKLGKDSCNGDSGGPLMGLGKYSTLKNTRIFAIGLVSYGHNMCGKEGYPGVYTRVLPYVSWILDNMKP